MHDRRLLICVIEPDFSVSKTEYKRIRNINVTLRATSDDFEGSSRHDSVNFDECGRRGSQDSFTF